MSPPGLSSASWAWFTRLTAGVGVERCCIRTTGDNCFLLRPPTSRGLSRFPRQLSPWFNWSPKYEVIKPASKRARDRVSALRLLIATLEELDPQPFCSKPEPFAYKELTVPIFLRKTVPHHD